MAHMPEQQREIYKLAVGMFGAVPGTRYFTELHGAFEAGMPLDAMYNALSQSPAFQTSFGLTPTSSHGQFAATFLACLLGSEVSGAGSAFAQSFMVGMLDAGLSRGEAMKAAIDALDRVGHNDPDFGRAAQRLDTRMEVARHHTEVLNASSVDIPHLQRLLDGGAQGPIVLHADDEEEGSGGVSINASGQSQSVLFLGSGGDDTYTGSRHGDTIHAGRGADAITLTNAGGLAAAGQIDTLILRAGDSMLNATANGHDVVNNFGTGSVGGALDVIDLGALGFSGQQSSGLANKGALAAAVVNGTTLFQDDFFVAGVARAVAIGTHAGDTFVFVDINGNADFEAEVDLFLQLNGVTDVTLANFGF